METLLDLSGRPIAVRNVKRTRRRRNNSKNNTKMSIGNIRKAIIKFRINEIRGRYDDSDGKLRWA